MLFLKFLSAGSTHKVQIRDKCCLIPALMSHCQLAYFQSENEYNGINESIFFLVVYLQMAIILCQLCFYVGFSSHYNNNNK